MCGVEHGETSSPHKGNRPLPVMVLQELEMMSAQETKSLTLWWIHDKCFTCLLLLGSWVKSPFLIRRRPFVVCPCGQTCQNAQRQHDKRAFACAGAVILLSCDDGQQTYNLNGVCPVQLVDLGMTFY